jgi:hypothetical protein
MLSRSCPLWVKSRHWGTSEQCPLYPQKRTLVEPVGMSALCHKQTSELLAAVCCDAQAWERRA